MSHTRGKYVLLVFCKPQSRKVTPPEFTKDRSYEKDTPCVGEEKLHVVDSGAAEVGLKALVLAPSVCVVRSETLGRDNTTVGRRR